MSPFSTEYLCVRVRTEAGDPVGWVSEDESRDLMRAHRATMGRREKGIRNIILVADESIPLSGASKQRALDGYSGRVKYTYRENIGTEVDVVGNPQYIGHQTMLKRVTAGGAFRPW